MLVSYFSAIVLGFASQGMIGPWELTEESGYCRASRRYDREQVSVTISATNHSGKEIVDMRVEEGSWRIRPNANLPVRVRIDSGREHRFAAARVNATAVAFTISDGAAGPLSTMPIWQSLRQGYTLNIAVNQRAYGLSLAGSSAALGAIEACLNPQSSPQARTSAAPRRSSAQSQQAAPPASQRRNSATRLDQAAELIMAGVYDLTGDDFDVRVEGETIFSSNRNLFGVGSVLRLPGLDSERFADFVGMQLAALTIVCSADGLEHLVYDEAPYVYLGYLGCDTGSSLAFAFCPGTEDICVFNQYGLNGDNPGRPTETIREAAYRWQRAIAQ